MNNYEYFMISKYVFKINVRLHSHSEFFFLFEDDNSDDDHNHCPGDLIDSLLDIDDEFNRRQFLFVSFLVLII